MAQPLKKLGKYEIHGTLGKGAMGIVYEGFDPMIERRVAIKTVAKDRMDPDEAGEMLGRFKREAQAAGRLNHPGIVSIYDYGEDQGLAYIAMELITGKELRKYFESDQRFELAQAVRIMSDMLDALDHAHRNGVIHRDIKPANIMITDDGRVKVADFGVARIESSMMTQIGTRIGTPAYMSPEQHQGLPVDGRSDVFSAGVMLYQFLTGERPFTGGGYTIVQQILEQDPIPPSEINVSIPRSLDLVVSKALAKRPEDRFPSARAFAQALQKAAVGQVPAEVDRVLDDAEAPTVRADNLSGAGDPRKATDIDTGGAGSNVALEAELEYWREIKDSNDIPDFEVFLQAFPDSRFAALARRRVQRLKVEAERSQRERTVPQQPPRAHIAPSQDSLKRVRREAEERAKAEAERLRRQRQERARLEAEAKARQEAEERARREAVEQARIQAEEGAQRESQERARLVEQGRIRKEAARARRQGEEQKRREAEEKARREAEQRRRREAEAQAKREAEERARREAEEKAKREAEERARQEAEARARREAEKKARLEAEAQARREAEEQARREAEARAQREAEEKARREAEEKARREAEEQARRDEEARRREALEREAEEQRRREEAPREPASSAPSDVDDSTVAMDLSTGQVGRAAGFGRLPSSPAHPAAEPRSPDSDRAIPDAPSDAGTRPATDHAATADAAIRPDQAATGTGKKSPLVPVLAIALLAALGGGVWLATRTASDEAAQHAIEPRSQADAERLARERSEQERLAHERAEHERLVRERADRIARDKAEQERSAREKAEQERIAREKKAEQERLAHEKKNEQELIAREKKAEQERIAREK